MKLPDQLDGKPHKRPSNYVKMAKRLSVRGSRRTAKALLKNGEEPPKKEVRFKGWEL